MAIPNFNNRTKHLSLVMVSFFLLIAGSAIAAEAVKLAASPEGITIDAGVAGIFTLEAPRLMLKSDDYNAPKPAVTVLDASTAVVRYATGGELTMRVAGSRIAVSYSGIPEEAHALRVMMLIPIRFGQGGQVGLDERALVALPATKKKNFLLQEGGTKLRLVDPSGGGFSLTMAGGFHEISDNRFYNWPTFAYIYTFGFKEHPGQNSFDILVEPAGTIASETGPKFMVDQFGQLAAKSFSGKVTSEDELKQDVAKEQAWLDSMKQPERDSYGGLPGSGEKYKLKKTGFFRVDQVAGRHVFVTPEGNIFYQLGVCCIQPQEDLTLVRGREKIYEWLPPKEGDFAGAWFKEDPTGVVSFYLANWIRKYGQPFDAEKWSAQAINRLQKWGFNSAGAWSIRTKTMQTKRFSGTVMLPLETWMAPGLKAMPGVDRMYDPFAPGTEEVIEKAFAQQVAPLANDPTIIGYFLGNEQLFENIPRIVPALKKDSFSKQRLVQLLQEKYEGDIAKFNGAWAIKTPFAKFEELGDATLFVSTPESTGDMREFLRLYLETYYSTVIRIFRKHDPNHLLLGSRWQPGTANNEMLVKIAAKYMDVISVNYYVYAVEPDFLKRIYDWSGGKPMLLSEWHFTSTDQGMGGHKEVANQKERGLAYRNYVETTAALPYVVGHQWFSNIDQSVTGRWFEGFNGEAANTGLINVTDRPYVDFITECKKTNDEIYRVVLGERPPFRFDDPRFSARSGAVRKSLSIPRALPGMKLDGTSQNWPGRPAEQLPAKNLTLGTPDLDFNAAFRLCWDDQFLYVLAEVKESTPLVNTQTGENLWQGDCLEIFIGGEKTNEPGALMPTDRQILLSAGMSPKFYVANSPVLVTDIRVVTAKNVTGEGYTIEAAIPWAVLGIKPESGKELLFDLGVDNTDDGKLRSRQWMWNGSERNSSDRGNWGRAKLLMN
ncbi:MAG: hypothetical protein B9S32_14520 [Verrucomicrobia bacterium Tous-C9LFEB]|nr:MAG: hypothetical protein B9S32_14520 [Verrucomicrobia bacterium Tous-C9LFEB]